MENVRRNRDIKLGTLEKRRSYLVSEPNYHTTKWDSEDLLAIKLNKIILKIDKPVYQGLSIFDSKTVMHEFWFDYVKPKYKDNIKLCFMDTDSFIVHVKTKNYKDIADDVNVLLCE